MFVHTMPVHHLFVHLQVVEEDVMAAPKRRGKTISDYEKWEVQQLINSGA